MHARGIFPPSGERCLMDSFCGHPRIGSRRGNSAAEAGETPASLESVTSRRANTRDFRIRLWRITCPAYGDFEHRSEVTMTHRHFLAWGLVACSLLFHVPFAGA